MRYKLAIPQNKSEVTITRKSQNCAIYKSELREFFFLLQLRVTTQMWLFSEFVSCNSDIISQNFLKIWHYFSIKVYISQFWLSSMQLWVKSNSEGTKYYFRTIASLYLSILTFCLSIVRYKLAFARKVTITRNKVRIVRETSNASFHIIVTFFLQFWLYFSMLVRIARN